MGLGLGPRGVALGCYIARLRRWCYHAAVRVPFRFDYSLHPYLDLAWTGADDFDTLFTKATEALTSLRIKHLDKKLGSVQAEIMKAERNAERNSDMERVLDLFQEKAGIKRRMLRFLD